MDSITRMVNSKKGHSNLDPFIIGYPGSGFSYRERREHHSSRLERQLTYRASQYSVLWQMTGAVSVYQLYTRMSATHHASKQTHPKDAPS